MSDMIETLSGYVEDVTFHSEESGFTVLELNTGDDIVCVVGEMGRIAAGEEAVFQGEWSLHPSFGRQFKAQKSTVTLPADASGILRYLSSGIIKGVRESTALKIVEAFGAESFLVIENEPDRLATIRGISKAKAKKISESFKNQFASREVMDALVEIGFTQSEAFMAYNMYHSAAIDIITENPYAFVQENVGYSFERADEIALSLQDAPDFSYRAQAAVVYIVRYNLRNGHTCIPRNAIYKPASNLLDCSQDTVEIALDNAIETGQLVSEQIGEKDFLFLPEIYQAESSIGDRIRIMTAYPPKQNEIFQSEILAFENANSIEFDEKQRLAIEIAVNKGLLILTGGPGTGKTTTVKGIITLMKNKGLSVALAAPTGRAAKRMTELTGCEAKTIHRLLEVEYKDGADSPSFVYNLRNPLDYDAVIVDELSMVDVNIFAALLDALPLHCRLIMVGDKDQLPPVGAGNILFDLIKSSLIDVVALDKVFRQAMESLIVTNAHRVVKGEMPVLDNNSDQSDFFFLNESSKYLVPKKIVDLVTRRIPLGYGYDPLTDIQVLCPSRKGETGTENLNALLQEQLNPKEKGKSELKFMGYTLREGDKVMQIKNNYDVPWFKGDDSGTGVFNGDIGVLTRIDRGADIINVRFDDREAMYSIENASQLELAYAMTVHKSQGSEFTAVVMPTVGASPKLCYRNLFYTALTRAKEMILLIGTQGSIHTMVENDKKSRRYSALVHFLSIDNGALIE